MDFSDYGFLGFGDDTSLDVKDDCKLGFNFR